jgi:type I restriction enzyme S subunit
MINLPQGWVSLQVASAFRLIGTSSKKIKTRNASSSGRYPVIDQGAQAVAGYSDDASLAVLASADTPVILFGDHTRALKFITRDFVPGADGTKLLQVKPMLQSRYAFRSLCAVQLPDKGYARHFQYLRDAEIPIPPLLEQSRIVTKLDAMLARVDATRIRLGRVPALLKCFSKSVLAAATSGELTEDWRGGTEAQWEEIPLGEYVDNLDGRRVPISESERVKRRGAYPYYGASGVIDTIDSYTHDGKFLLVGEDGANLLTRTKPIAFIAEGRIWVNNHAHIMKCKNGAPEEYLSYYINSIDLAPYVTGSAQPKLNQRNMNQILVPVPPLEEQVEIVRRVESLFAIADKVQAQYEAARARVDKLTPALLAKAFRGELVPQDPNEESAEKLLQRLRADNADEASVTKSRRTKAPAKKTANKNTKGAR